jgi:alanine-alpha-ketoisovalerate/valine-pyruvate aminotransferase
MERILDHSKDSEVIKKLDAGLDNVWGWQWMEEKIEMTIGSSSKSFYLSEWIQKIDERGLAKCIICKCAPGLREKGKIALTGHCKSKSHTHPEIECTEFKSFYVIIMRLF